MIHGRGVDKALLAEEKPLESQNATAWYFISIQAYTLQKYMTILKQICNSLAL